MSPTSSTAHRHRSAYAHRILFFVFSRARPGAAAAAERLVEEHWAYMDRFADRMIARGPTLAPDRETWTGSLHVVDLPDADAARDFVAAEPFERAGLFREHLVCRFRDRLGRTMWDFRDDGGQPRFLVVARRELADVRAEDAILHGDLLTADEAAPAGSALAVRAPTREGLAVLLGAGEDLEIHDWEFGGRR